mmetsp:Transcript_3951/g.10298  ORF Transcript_3951/g.10298 Transcript_3951/m.10298 type:complete len:207 (+) Transcript_3951:1072-1692(+)
MRRRAAVGAPRGGGGGLDGARVGCRLDGDGARVGALGSEHSPSEDSVVEEHLEETGEGEGRGRRLGRVEPPDVRREEEEEGGVRHDAQGGIGEPREAPEGIRRRARRVEAEGAEAEQRRVPLAHLCEGEGEEEARVVEGGGGADELGGVGGGLPVVEPLGVDALPRAQGGEACGGADGEACGEEVGGLRVRREEEGAERGGGGEVS